MAIGKEKSSTNLLDNDKIHGETLNTISQHPIDTDSGATGTAIKEDGVLYMQKFFRGKLYYKLYNIYMEI